MAEILGFFSCRMVRTVTVRFCSSLHIFGSLEPVLECLQRRSRRIKRIAAVIDRRDTTLPALRLHHRECDNRYNLAHRRPELQDLNGLSHPQEYRSDELRAAQLAHQLVGNIPCLE